MMCMIDMVEFMTKKDWSSIFVASCLLILLLLLSLMGVTFTWVMIGILVLISAFTFYRAYIRKYAYSDTELEDGLKSMKDNLFGAKK